MVFRVNFVSVKNQLIWEIAKKYDIIDFVRFSGKGFSGGYWVTTVLSATSLQSAKDFQDDPK